ncbi:hypothetical protein EV715DRAFT_288177 [Schizophyllum commune]
MSELAAMGSDASSIFITRALAPVYTPHADLRTALSSTAWKALLRTLNTPHRRKELRQLVNLLLRAFLADRFERTAKARRVKRVAKGEVEGDDAVEDENAVADEALFEGWMTAMLSPPMLANMFACSAILPPDLAAKAVELGVDVPLPNQIAVDIFLCFLHEINTKSPESLRLFLDTLYAPLLGAVLEDRTRSRLKAREMRNESLTARRALASRRSSAPSSGLARPADFNLAKAPCFDSSGLLVLDRDFACSIRTPAAAPPATTAYASSFAIAHLEPSTPALCAFRGQWNTMIHVLCSTRNRAVYSPLGSTHNEDDSDTSDGADSDSGSDADSSTDLAAFLFCVDDGRHDFPQFREGCLNDVRNGIAGLYGDICAGLYDHRNPCVRKFLRALGLANSVACEDLLRQTDLDFQVPVKLLVEEPRKIAKKNAVAGDSSAINENVPRTTDTRIQTSAPEARTLSNVRSLPASSARTSTTTPAFATSSATLPSFLTASAPFTRPSATPSRSSSTSSRSSATSALSAASSWMPVTPTPVSDPTTPRSFFGFTTPKPLASTCSRIPPGATPTPIALVGVPSALGEAPLTPSDFARTRTPSSSTPDPSTLATFDPASFASASTPAAKAFRPAASTSTTFPSTSTADSCSNISMPELSQADLLKRGRQALRPVHWDDMGNVSAVNAVRDFGKRKRTVSCGERSIDIGGRASSVKERTALFEQRAATFGGQTLGAGSRASGPSMSTPYATERTPSLGRPMLYASQRMPSTSGRVRTLSARAASEDERVALFKKSITILDVSAPTPIERTPTHTERAPDVVEDAEDALDAKRVGVATGIIQRITKGSSTGSQFDDAGRQAQGGPHSLGKRKRQASQLEESQVKQSPDLSPHVVPFALSAQSWNALDEAPADPAKTKRWLSSAKIRFYVYMCDLLARRRVVDEEFGKAWLDTVTSPAHRASMFAHSAIMRPDLAAKARKLGVQLPEDAQAEAFLLFLHMLSKQRGDERDIDCRPTGLTPTSCTFREFMDTLYMPLLLHAVKEYDEQQHSRLAFGRRRVVNTGDWAREGMKEQVRTLLNVLSSRSNRVLRSNRQKPSVWLVDEVA